MTGQAVRAVLGLPTGTRQDLEVRVLLGSGNNEADAIWAAAEQADVDLIVKRDVQDMASEMAWADLAVTSGGSTVWELARSGCPALVVETAAVERLLVAGLEQIVLFDRLGAADQLDEAMLRSAIETRLNDGPWRTEMAQRGPRLVDGRGAARVVNALAKLDTR
jgi:spore coat polysaccharide biosynthesis predicted glycosyltransferase SpsG